jgi:uncharacterized protein YbjT (DUF2867 family)
VRILVTGGSGVIGRSLVPLLEKAGHQVLTPGSRELDLFDPSAVRNAVEGVEAFYHLNPHSAARSLHPARRLG